MVVFRSKPHIDLNSLPPTNIEDVSTPPQRQITISDDSNDSIIASGYHSEFQMSDIPSTRSTPGTLKNQNTNIIDLNHQLQIDRGPHSQTQSSRGPSFVKPFSQIIIYFALFHPLSQFRYFYNSEQIFEFHGYDIWNQNIQYTNSRFKHVGSGKPSLKKDCFQFDHKYVDAIVQYILKSDQINHDQELTQILPRFSYSRTSFGISLDSSLLATPLQPEY